MARQPRDPAEGADGTVQELEVYFPPKIVVTTVDGEKVQAGHWRHLRDGRTVLEFSVKELTQLIELLENRMEGGT